MWILLKSQLLKKALAAFYSEAGELNQNARGFISNTLSP